MISAPQIRAARALLDWSQAELVRAARLTPAALSRLETGLAKGRSHTLERLEETLTQAGIEFLEGEGVRFRRKSVSIVQYDGADAIQKMQDDIFTVMLSSPEKEMVLNGVDERKFFANNPFYLQRQGRYDAICASVFNLPRAGTIDYTTQYIYVPVYAYTQTTRSNNLPDITKIDWQHTNVIGMDGEGATTIARQRLPQAKFTILPDLSSIPEILTSLASNKGDVAFVMPTVFANYDKNNPGKLQKIPGNAFHVFPVSFAIKTNEPALKDTFDIIIRNLLTSGELDEIINRYDPDKLLYRVAKPYEVNR